MLLLSPVQKRLAIVMICSSILFFMVFVIVMLHQSTKTKKIKNSEERFYLNDDDMLNEEKEEDQFEASYNSAIQTGHIRNGTVFSNPMPQDENDNPLGWIL